MSPSAEPKHMGPDLVARHGRTRAHMRALIADLDATMRELGDLLPCSLRTVFRRDIERGHALLKEARR
jgi:hypothetical protein